MRRFVKGPDGKFRGSSGSGKKAPTAQHGLGANTTSHECGRDNATGEPSNYAGLSARWNEITPLPSSRVVPQRTIISAPSLRAARELVAHDYNHIRADITVMLDHKIVQERLLAAGFTCAIPHSTPAHKEHLGAPNSHVDVEALVGTGIWRIQPRDDDGDSTAIITPFVTNNDEGWGHIQQGLRRARGIRGFAPKTRILITAATLPAPPPPPPAGFAPIRGVRALAYSG